MLSERPWPISFLHSGKTLSLAHRVVAGRTTVSPTQRVGWCRGEHRARAAEEERHGETASSQAPPSRAEGKGPPNAFVSSIP